MVNLRSRILLPTTLILLVVLVATAAVLNRQVEHTIADQALGQRRYIQRLFQAKLAEHAEKMTATLLTLQSNPAVVDALARQDTNTLFELSFSLYEQLRSRDFLESFAYLNSDKATVLRVENPKSTRLVVQKVTTRVAARSGKIAQGLEFGRLAKLYLWTVAPWRENKSLIGYVELGTSVDQILLRLARLLDPTLYLALDKNYIGKDEWRHRQRSSKNAMDWNRFLKHVVVPVGSSKITPDVAEIIEVTLNAPIPESVPQYSIGESEYCLSRIPIVDVHDHLVAEILAVVDITKLVNQSTRASNMVLGTVSMVGVGLLAVLFLLANFTQKQLIFSQQALVNAKNELKKRFIDKAQELQRSETDYRELVENANSIILRWTPEGQITFVNQFALHFFGFDEEQIVGKNLLETIIPNSLNFELKDLKRMADELVHSPVGHGNNEFEHVKQDGTLVWISWTNRAIKDELSNVVEVLSIGHDISGKKKAEKELNLAASVFENIVEGVMITGPDGKILRTNRAFTLITGFDEQQAFGKTPEAFFDSSHHGPGFYRMMWETVSEKGLWQGEVWNKRSSDESYPQRLSISAIQDIEGNNSHYVGVFTDITEQKRNQEQIYRLAHFDSLTGLPNRILFQDRLSHGLAKANRNEVCLPLLFLDLDRFKSVNDSLGHGAGDLLLQQVSTRLAECVRASDTLARMGGDEFTVILGPSPSIQEVIVSVTRVSHNILKSLSKPFELEGNRVIISTSIGVAVYPQDSDSVSDLLRNADLAMYHAKQESLGFSFYQPEMNRVNMERLNLERDLYEALEKEQFEVFYQPCMRLSDGSVEALEALIRWHHPARGLIDPDQFIGVAEEIGLVSQLGEWVLSTAVNQAVFWRGQGLPSVRIAVNVSPYQFRDKLLVAMVKSVLDESGFPPDQLILEVTESLFLDPLSDEAAATIKELSALGVCFAIDDFGVGYSSLARLKLLPIDTLKVDRSFIAGLFENENDASITCSVIQMAHSLKLNVVAEGVETQQQFDYLKQQGCDTVQGYFVARPVPARDTEKILETSPDHTGFISE